MTQEIQKQLTVKELFANQSIQGRFNELLGKKAQGFITSVLQIVNQNAMLKNADPNTVLTAAATAATLDLPINPNLGFAYIIPYNNNVKTPTGWEKKVMAQFQMGYKGFIQLAQRSGQYKRINAVPVYENQFKGYNTLTEHLDANFTITGTGEIVGFAAFFQLVNGFEKLTYWPVEMMNGHAKRYSKSYGQKNSLWTDTEGGFEAMGIKTVLKHIISKYGPLSIEMQTAVQADQAVQVQEGEYQYVDNDQKGIDIDHADYTKERSRILAHIAESTTQEQLGQVFDMINEYDVADEYNAKWDELEKPESDGKAKK